MNCVGHCCEISTKLLGRASRSAWLLALLVLALAAMPLQAQVQNGIFTGTVTDPQGAAVASAEVVVTNIGTNSTVTVKTGTEGSYHVPELQVGTYKFTVSAPGFKKAVKAGIFLGAGAIERVDFKLEVGAQSETVTVEASAVQVQTEDARLYGTVSQTQIANLPLNGRNVFDLITLAPGAVDATGVSFENGHSTVVNGLRPNFNGFLINGSSDKGLSGGVITTPNADIVQEFQELTLNMSAQYGNSGAAIVNVVTKSGTNSFHGTAYGFWRDDKLDANDTFLNEAGTPRPELRYGQFGATATGPIWKNHIFFTATYQGDRYITNAAPTNILTESPEWRAIVASAFPNSVANKIYSSFPASNGDPANPNSLTLANYINGNNGSSGSGFAAFGDYMCPDNFPTGFTGLATGQFTHLFGITAADQAYLAGTHPKSSTNPTPVPNCPTYLGAPPPITPGVVTDRNMPFLNENTLVFGSQLSPNNGNLFDGNEWSTRIDWNVGQNDHVFGEYNWIHTKDQFGAVNASSGIHGFKNPTASHFPNFQASWVHTFNPNLVNEARAGYVLNRTDVSVATPGIPSVGFDDGSAGFGSYNGYPQFFHENIYTYGDMMSLQKGKHSLKFGADFRRNLENSEFNIARPSYYFMDQIFFAADSPYGMVGGTDPGFVSGRPAQLADNFRHWRNLEVGAYFQDDWKVTKKLTLNLGIRYDLFTRHTEKNGLVTTFLPGPGCQHPSDGFCIDAIQNANAPAATVVGDPNFPGCNTAAQIANNVLAGVCGPGGFAIANSLGAANHKNWGPRAGFAYDPLGTGKTVIRGGFGISYEGTLYNPLSNSRWNPPFYNFAADSNALCTIEGACSPTEVVYGPTAACPGGAAGIAAGCGPIAGVANCNTATTACVGSGAAVTFTGPPANPGIGTGAQGTGNIQGFYGLNPKFANLTGIVFPSGLRDPHIFNYYFGVQREIMPRTVLEVDYVGTEGRNLFRADQGNRLPGIALSAGTTVVDNLGRTWTGLGRRYLNPNYAILRIWNNTSRSWYDSVQASVKRQAARGLLLNVAYTYGHSIDTGSGWHSSTTTANGSAGGDGYLTDVTRPNLDRGNSTFDVRHRLTFNYVYEFPWMREQRGLVGHILGGWQYQGLWAFQTGAHFTPYCATGSACDFNKDGTRNDRPDVPNGNTFSPSRSQWMNGWFGGSSQFGCAWSAAGRVVGSSGFCADGVTPAFFGTPCSACDGNLGRNTFVGPGFWNTDESVFKNIKATERYNLQFRFEVFNALNHPNFKLPSSATGANFANRITSGIFGQSAGEINPRLIQFGLKFIW